MKVEVWGLAVGGVPTKELKIAGGGVGGAGVDNPGTQPPG